MLTLNECVEIYMNKKNTKFIQITNKCTHTRVALQFNCGKCGKKAKDQNQFFFALIIFSE